LNLNYARLIPQERRKVVLSLLFGGLALVLIAAVARYLRTPAKVLHGAIRVGELDREYRLVIPECTRGKKDLPVLFALHGALGTTDEMAADTGLDQLAAKHGFLLVYLQGRNGWPAVSAEGGEAITRDLDFFDALCDTMVARYAADPARIYVVGVSQGGAMCNWLVAMRSQRIAAAVCNCGWMPKPFDEKPLHTPHKTPMLFLVGSLDTRVPPDAVQQARDIFAEGGHPVELRILEGVGHGWARKLGTNELIWKFLGKKKL
jgi:poly(3-hydroxybutyrate) depolymerase